PLSNERNRHDLLKPVVSGFLTTGLWRVKPLPIGSKLVFFGGKVV
ncbi:hypothetical protein ABMB67_003893, partial [Halalkalibacter oceani]